MIAKTVVVCLMAACLGICADPVGYRQYPHFGVSMQHLGKVDLQAQRWVHEFTIPIPSLDQLYSNITYCRAQSPSCEQDTPMTNGFIEAINKMVKARHNKFVVGIETMFPRPKVFPRSNSVQYVPLKFKALDIPTVNASQVLNIDHIKAFDIPVLDVAKYKPLGYILDRDVDALFKYADNVQSGLFENDGHMRGLAGNITAAMRAMTYNSFETASYVSAAATAALEALNAMDTLHAASLYLAIGVLPSVLVDKNDIGEAIKKIRSSVHFSSSRFQIAETNADYYYTLRTVRTARLDEKLSIYLEVPVSTKPEEVWDHYYTFAYPLATSQDLNTMAATELSGFKPYLLVSPDGGSYVELSEMEMSSCTGTQRRFCQHLYSAVSSVVPSCHWGLYKNDFDMVSEQCTLSFLKTGIRPYMMELEPGLYLMNKVQNPLLDCPKKVLDANVFTPCQQCLRRIPCQCSINSDFVASRARMVEGCEDDFDGQTNYTLNLLLMRRAGRTTGGLTGMSSVDKTVVKKLGVTFSEKELVNILSNKPTEVNIMVQNLPTAEMQVESIPTGLGAGGIVALLVAMGVVVMAAFTYCKWNKLQKEMAAISARQAGLDLPIVVNGNGNRHEDEESHNRLMEAHQVI